jgi:hypothetical protein
VGLKIREFPDLCLMIPYSLGFTLSLSDLLVTFFTSALVSVPQEGLAPHESYAREGSDGKRSDGYPLQDEFPVRNQLTEDMTKSNHQGGPPILKALGSGAR